jgi:hypothetical protein
VLRNVVAIEEWPRRGDDAAGDVLSELEASGTFGNHADGGDELLHLASDVGAIPRRALRSEPEEDQLCGDVAVDRADRRRPCFQLLEVL